MASPWVADERTHGLRAYGDMTVSAAELAAVEVAAVEVAAVVVAIDGELGPEALPGARAHLDRVLSLGPKHVVIDLAGCPFLDAAAIAFLLEVHRQLWRTDGRLSLRSPSPRVRRILRTARVDGVLDVVPPLGADPRDRRPLEQLPLCVDAKASRPG